MQTSKEVGISLIGQAHVGALISLLVLIASCFVSFDSAVLFYSVGFGGLTGILLLAYWQGKGGIFFIGALLSPLMAVMLSPLDALLLILPLVSGFFLALCAVLTVFNRLKKAH